MKISPYTIYLELHPNALLVRQIFYYLQKVGVTHDLYSIDCDIDHYRARCDILQIYITKVLSKI
jgi:hypothetical protein